MIRFSCTGQRFDPLQLYNLPAKPALESKELAHGRATLAWLAAGLCLFDVPSAWAEGGGNPGTLCCIVEGLFVHVSVPSNQCSGWNSPCTPMMHTEWGSASLNMLHPLVLRCACNLANNKSM